MPFIATSPGRFRNGQDDTSNRRPIFRRGGISATGAPGNIPRGSAAKRCRRDSGIRKQAVDLVLASTVATLRSALAQGGGASALRGKLTLFSRDR
jgi:hypothetical protein